MEIPAQNSSGGDGLNTNHIKLNQVDYELHRVYNGKVTAVNLVRDRLLEVKSHNLPLTEQPTLLYNKHSGTGMSKEEV